MKENTLLSILFFIVIMLLIGFIAIIRKSIKVQKTGKDEEVIIPLFGIYIQIYFHGENVDIRIYY